MNKEERSRYFDELTKNLCRVGFTVNSEDAELLPVELNGQSLCCVTENGGIQYHWAGVVSDDKRAALDKVMYVAGVTFEYMRLMETAQQVAAHLPASELKGDYRVLAEFNSAVLAGQPTQHGCQFVTWSLSQRGTLCQGNYFGPNVGSDCYVEAKRDFAVRSGLIPKSSLFSQEQQAEIYRSIHSTLENDDSITYGQEECLKSVLEQIEDSLPNVEQIIGKEQQ